jgi:hypothetical protein
MSSGWRTAARVVLLLVANGCRGTSGELERMPDFYGVRLGMSPREVRARFSEQGTWETVPAQELTLSWKRATAANATRADFEFHNGILVAFTTQLAATEAFAQGALTVTPAAVRTCRTLDSAANGRECRVIARDCPTHAEEVRRLLAAKP